MNKRRIYILSIILFGLVLIVGTFAWFTWRSSETTLVLKVGEIDDAEVILKPYQINKEIIPVLTYEGEEYTSVEAINKNTDSKRIILYYHINNIDSELINDNFKYTILKSTDNGNTYTEYISGNFSNTSSDSEFYIMNEKIDANTSYKYKVYLWLDGSSSGQGNIQGKSFDGELRTEILDGKIYANLGGTTDFYKADAYREKITKVEFVNNLDIPNGSVTFDLGAYPSKTDEVKGWLVSNGTDTYTLKIGANDKIYAKDLGYTFYNMEGLTEISFTNLDTSETTNMMYMFYNCNSLASLDMSNFNTSKVFTMFSMFNGCSSLTSLNLSHFNTSNVNNMAAMFWGCTKLTSLNISTFKTQNVTNMYGMFAYCNSLTSLDVSSFDTSKVTNMYAMFFDCITLTSLNVSNFNTSNVENMYAMFYGCEGITSLDLSHFNTSNVNTMEVMFWRCRKLTSLNISAFKTQNVTNMHGMFAYCNSLASLNVSSFNTSKVENMEAMFFDCFALTSLNISNFDTSNVTNMRIMFYELSTIKTLDLSNFNTFKVTNMEAMFYNNPNLTNIYVSNLWNTASVTNSDNMFLASPKLPNYNSSYIDKSKAHYGTGGYLTYKA